MSLDAVWKSTSELGFPENYCGPERRRADAVTGTTQAHVLRHGQSSHPGLHRRGQRQHGEHHERRRLSERHLVRIYRTARHLLPIRHLHRAHEGGDGLRDARPQAG